MSATPTLIPPPRPAPERAVPTAVPPKAGKPSFRIWVLLGLLAGGAFTAYKFLGKTQAQNQAAQSSAFRTAKVTSGSIRKVLRLTGSTSAKNFRSIAAPMMRSPEGGRALSLIYLAPSGSHVKQGDLVAEIDAQAMKDHVDDIEAQIAQLEVNVRKRKAEQALNWETLLQNIRVVKARLDKAQLDASAGEIRTPIDAELAKLAVEEAEATYKELQADLDGKKIAFAAELRIVEIDKELQVRHRERHVRDIESFRIRAPISGLIVMQTLRRAGEMGQVQLGDMVAPGQPFMKIVDTGSMHVQATVSQVESEEMRLGQAARVRFDAFPDLALNASVVNIGAIATSGPRANYFLRTVPVFLSIQGSDPRVIPDLSTSSDVVIAEAETSPLIPLAAVESRAGKSFVRVKRGEGYETREVKLGLNDKIQVAVLEGVEVGEEIALDHPAATVERAGV